MLDAANEHTNDESQPTTEERSDETDRARRNAIYYQDQIYERCSRDLEYREWFCSFAVDHPICKNGLFTGQLDA